MKIGIVGGSFDPIHYGHIQMAKTALEQCDCQEVWFMPTQDTPLKERSLTESRHRVAMIEKVLAMDTRFKLCLKEVQRQGKSYTIDTLRELKQEYSDDAFVWMIGNDQLAQFDQWKEVDQLVQLADFVCVDRDGALIQTKYPVQRIHMPMMPVSSSEIRKGNKLNYVPEAVLAYIYANRLYIKDFVKERVDEKRYRHSVSVANLCEEMALANGLDGQKAYLIGLFHDIAKRLPLEEMEKWMDAICPEHKHYAPPVWHGFVGSEIVDRIFYLQDPEIKAAIYHHVLGTSENPYAMIVFCADKTDPLRDYDSTKEIALCKKDIKAGFQWIKEENEKYLRKEK